MSKIKINKRTEYEMVIPTNTFRYHRFFFYYRYKTDGDGYWEIKEDDYWVPVDDGTSILLELIFQTNKGDIIGEPSDDRWWYNDGENNDASG